MLEVDKKIINVYLVPIYKTMCKPSGKTKTYMDTISIIPNWCTVVNESYCVLFVCVRVVSSLALPLYCKLLDSEYKTIYSASLYSSHVNYGALYIVDAE